MPFELVDTPLPGLLLLRSRLFDDERGYFLESYKESDLRQLDITDHFSQDNHSYSRAGVIRGLHFQRSPADQAKLVRATVGRIWDVAVDLRRESPTYSRWTAVELTARNGLLLYIPPGFAHGFAALTDAHLSYKCSAEYDPARDAGIRWDDPQIAISWPIETPTVSAKDRALPFFADLNARRLKD